MTPEQKLTELYELSKQSAEQGWDWWPESLTEYPWNKEQEGGYEGWFYDGPFEGCIIDPDHALRLVESYARDALREFDYAIEVTKTDTVAISRNGYVTVYRSYADALRAEIGRVVV